MGNLFYEQLEKESEEKQIINQDLLIIKCPSSLSQGDINFLYKKFISQKAKGLIMLPAGFEAVYIPHDCEIVVKTEEDGEYESTGCFEETYYQLTKEAAERI